MGRGNNGGVLMGVELFHIWEEVFSLVGPLPFLLLDGVRDGENLFRSVGFLTSWSCMCVCGVLGVM